MSNVTKNEQMRYIELKNIAVDYSSSEVVVFDRVKDFAPLYPLQPLTTLLAVCTKGKHVLVSDNEEYELKENHLMICPPGTTIKPGEKSSDFECKVICSSEQLIRTLIRDKASMLDEKVFANEVYVLDLQKEGAEEFNFYFSLIQSKLKSPTTAFPYEILLALMRALFLEICYRMEVSIGVVLEHKLSQGKILFNRFLTLISSSAVKRQSIRYYAGELAITPKYLTMLCLKYSNKTASEWVTQYTMEEIRYYLKSTELSIKEISAMMGFSNMSHFGSYVRKHLGMSPSEYRYSKKK